MGPGRPICTILWLNRIRTSVLSGKAHILKQRTAEWYRHMSSSSVHDWEQASSSDDLPVHLARLLEGTGVRPRDTDGEVKFEGRDPLFPSAVRLGSVFAISAMAAAVGAAAIWRMRTGEGQDLFIDLRKASHGIVGAYVRSHTERLAVSQSDRELPSVLHLSFQDEGRSMGLSFWRIPCPAVRLDELLRLREEPWQHRRRHREVGSGGAGDRQHGRTYIMHRPDRGGMGEASARSISCERACHLGTEDRGWRPGPVRPGRTTSERCPCTIGHPCDSGTDRRSYTGGTRCSGAADQSSERVRAPMGLR